VVTLANTLATCVPDHDLLVKAELQLASLVTRRADLRGGTRRVIERRGAQRLRTEAPPVIEDRTESRDAARNH
jgi:hypothetical protein